MPEPGKNAPGLRGFPTPDEMTTNDGYLVFRFPKENDYAGLLLGAAQALTHFWNFYQWGDMTPEEAAEQWRIIVQEAPYNLIDAPLSVPAPFWDEDADVNGEATPELQTWYGYVTDLDNPTTTFVEDVTIYSFAGFLAIAATPAAAILFTTIAPAFVIAIRRGDLGEIIRLYLDGEEAASVDTAAYAEGDVIRVTLAGDPELSTHEIMLVNATS